MHYVTVLTQKDLNEFIFNTVEISNNHFTSSLPEHEESVTYTVNGGTIFVKYEENEDGTVVYGNTTYNFKVIPKIIGLACAMHKVNAVKIGTSYHSVHVCVNDPHGEFHATFDGITGSITRHQIDGMVFRLDGGFYMAVSDDIIADIYRYHEHTPLSLKVIKHDYLIRFVVGDKYYYYPLAFLYLEQMARESYLIKSDPDFDWGAKRAEVEVFLKEKRHV